MCKKKKYGLLLFDETTVRTVTRSEVKHRDTKQYGGPRAMADGCVHRLFQYVIRSVQFVERSAVQLDPEANHDYAQSSQICYRLDRKNKTRHVSSCFQNKTN